MYTANQIDCLNELGIKFYDLKEPSEPMLKKVLMEDLKILFPTLKIEGQRCQLSADFSWLIEPNATRLIATNSQVISKDFSALTWRQKKDFWLAIQSHAVEFDDGDEAERSTGFLGS